MKISISEAKIAVVGLGYVGLPLAIEFARKYYVLGFDTKADRIAELSLGRDSTKEANLDLLKLVTENNSSDNIRGLSFSDNKEDLKYYNVFVVTVPTPIDNFKTPNLEPLIRASRMIGKVLKKGDVVIYESTVYPGCTEEECVPVLEENSSLVYNKDFFVGYSPERISPGDKIHTLTTIKKVTSGSKAEIADFVDDLYASIITAGTYKAPSIKVAEASKAIENAQRDVNISFINELALIFDRMGIDTNDVIDAASTKWNFLKYQPGLVGGHCIGVDPYYLAHKAEALGYHPQVILSGRRVNDQIGSFIANKVIKLMIKKEHKIKGSRALILGITFKENCPDVRNTRVIDIYEELLQFGLEVEVYDPWADVEEVEKEYGIKIINKLIVNTSYDAIILAVAHKEFLEMDFEKIKNEHSVVFDTKACLNRDLVDARL